MKTLEIMSKYSNSSGGSSSSGSSSSNSSSSSSNSGSGRIRRRGIVRGSRLYYYRWTENLLVWSYQDIPACPFGKGKPEAARVLGS